MTERFRAPLASGLNPVSGGVDVERGIIFGASAMQSVEVLGHDCVADAETLKRVVDLGNAQSDGIKVRFTHPGLCADGMGTYLGRMRDFRVDGDKAVGDIHLGKAAANSPDGDLRSYVLQLAQEDPSSFGMSVVVSADRVWSVSGTDYPLDAKPDACAAELPSLRPTALHACDVVDEPAANRDGMFGRGAALIALSRASNADASEAFAMLDQLRDQLGMPQDKAITLLSAYVQARTKPDAPITFARVRELIAAHADRMDAILSAAESGMSERQIIAQIEDAQRAELAQKTAILLDKHAATIAAKDAQLAQLKDAYAAETQRLRTELASAQALARIAAGAARDPGTGTGAQDLPSYSSDDLSAGRVPADVMASGNYTISR